MADNKSRAVTEVNEYYNELGKSTEETGKKVGQSFENLSVKVDLDCSDALTGLKALQREARKATQAIAELSEKQSEYSPVTVDELLSEERPKGIAEYYWEKVRDIRRYTTEELTEELAKREGVRSHRSSDIFEPFPDNCRILVVTD